MSIEYDYIAPPEFVIGLNVTDLLSSDHLAAIGAIQKSIYEQKPVTKKFTTCWEGKEGWRSGLVIPESPNIASVFQIAI